MATPVLETVEDCEELFGVSLKTPEEWEKAFGVTLAWFYPGWTVPFTDALYSGITRTCKDPREPVDVIEFLDRSMRCEKAGGHRLPPFSKKISMTCSTKLEEEGQ